MSEQLWPPSQAALSASRLSEHCGQGPEGRCSGPSWPPPYGHRPSLQPLPLGSCAVFADAAAADSLAPGRPGRPRHAAGPGVTVSVISTGGVLLPASVARRVCQSLLENPMGDITLGITPGKHLTRKYFSCFY